MCGIAGVVAWDDRCRVTRETLGRMSARIAHRGPDGDGLYLNHEGEVTPGRPQVGLVHRRLAIIDPDPRANQPFGDGEGRWIVFNGEIYNYRELRAELKSLKQDYVWRTDCDTEVLLAAFAVWGEKCVEHLNGMFAFAVWDERAGSLFLARDRMGQKPLYYAYRSDGKSGVGVITFCSELPAMAGVEWWDRTVSRPAILSYLRWGYIGDGATVYTGAQKLEPSWWLRASDEELRCAKYYEPAMGDYPTAPPPGTTRQLVMEAVRRQLVSDVPLGVFLSGGIDSSIVATAVREINGGGESVQTFSIGFDDVRYDETKYARAVAKHLGTRHHCFIVRPDAAIDLPKLATAFGEPFGDSSALPTHYLARETRRTVKVALSGDGGDELFGGYDRYRAMRLGERIKRLPNWLVGTTSLPFPLCLLPAGNPKSFAARSRRFLWSLRMGSARRYSSYIELFDRWGASNLLRGTIPRRTHREVEVPLIALYRSLHPLFYDVVQAALAVDRATYLPGDLLTKVDRASMLHALEVRSPFMDHELVTFAAGLTTDQLLKGGPKRMLREAFAADLPAWVFKRKKMGFAVPIGDWFRDRKGPVRAMLHDHLFAADAFAATHFQMPTVRRLVDEHESGKVDHAQRLYALLMLELWWRGQANS